MASGGASGAIIFQWLERIGLGYSIPTFQAMGITNPHSLVTLTVEDYDAGACVCACVCVSACTCVYVCVRVYVHVCARRCGSWG